MSFTKDKKTFQAAVCELMAACGRDGCVEGWISLDTGEIVTRKDLVDHYNAGADDVEEGETLDQYIDAVTAEFCYTGVLSLGGALDMLAHWDDDLIPDDDDSI